MIMQVLWTVLDPDKWNDVMKFLKYLINWEIVLKKEVIRIPVVEK